MGVVPPAALAVNADLHPPILKLFDRAVASLLAALSVVNNTPYPSSSLPVVTRSNPGRGRPGETVVRLL
jgi:hypothetical protein